MRLLSRPTTETSGTWAEGAETMERSWARPAGSLLRETPSGLNPVHAVDAFFGGLQNAVVGGAGYVRIARATTGHGRSERSSRWKRADRDPT